MIGSTLIVILFAVFVYFRFYFVFGEGVKAGEINYFVHKGYIFKTYEGKIIQEGFGRGKTGGVTSYEFEFSVEDPDVFKKLEMNSGKTFDLHYKEYNGALPWRGNTKYVVDKIVSMK